MELGWLIPAGSMAALALVAMALNRAAGRELRRIHSVGRVCAACGYDLRATPDVCPECGLPVTGAPLPLTFALNWAAMNDAVTSAPLEARRPEAHEQPVALYCAEASLGLELLVEYLKADGIAARLERGAARSLPHDPTQTLVSFRVLVWSGDATRAVAILERFRLRGPEEEACEGVVRAVDA